MQTPVLDIPDIFTEEERGLESDLPWNVILFNDDHHTVQEVVIQVQKATGVAMETAFEITMQAHTHGKAVCYSGTHGDCEKVASVLREIALTVEIVQAEA